MIVGVAQKNTLYSSSPTRLEPAWPSKLIESKLPIQADKFVSKQYEPQRVERPSLNLMRKVGGTMGAAVGSLCGNLALLGWATLAGAGAGSMVAGPIGLAVGSVMGMAAGAYVAGKTMLGRIFGAVGGAVMGQLSAPVLKMIDLPVSLERAKIVESFSNLKLVKNLGEFSHSSLASVSKKEVDEFVASLKPGDVVLTRNEAASAFAFLTSLPIEGQSEFNHSLFYLGDGQAIEATTGKGVHLFDLKESLAKNCHHAVAIRPDYEEGQVEQVLAHSKKFLGVGYDYLFRQSDSSIYCSELVAKSLQTEAPQVDVLERHFLGKSFTLPDDFLASDDGMVIAEIGKKTTLFNALASKFS